MGSFKIKGLDKLQKDLKQMQKAARELENTKEISFDELFNPKFMTSYTNFNSFNELLIAGGYKVNNVKDFEAIPDDEFDNHVQSSTRFSSWEEMYDKATEQYFTKKLGF